MDEEFDWSASDMAFCPLADWLEGFPAMPGLWDDLLTEIAKWTVF